MGPPRVGHDCAQYDLLQLFTMRVGVCFCFSSVVFFLFWFLDMYRKMFSICQLNFQLLSILVMLLSLF